MVIKVYYSEISAHKEVKKRQQKVMMILESKQIPYEAIDITEAGRESDKDFMLTNGKAKEGSKVLSPQVFNEETYCGDYDDFELANENDELEKFLNVEKRPSIVRNGSQNGTAAINGTSRESSAEKQVVVEEKVVEELSSAEVASSNPVPTEEESPALETDAPPQESHTDGGDEEEEMSTSEPVPQPPAEESLDNIQPDPEVEEEEEELED
ncbi:SH3 domain-binding glutamic acid-rich protein homolog [Folsomia candida]|uniref:SH3 domain-binding glutamic acid-rich protein n=1 Tax=Folsomia candida TaxID=158441 RepID=A0A226DX38_FOLCA|nr:SH3 domain-binding glutamic acid-rich protein homolog [Folsomia candida]XP_021957806.1 SH3 domain-binding glutamic acid-rich protein homolog [Folsomia candida]XP_021957807.1 SH3 domain-binding glutamic acid-rich protein homolog [Folsomia candida]OXA50045.1 SH3 domain-binding glutamic acid-rich protein [Folsomia candida]